MAHLSHQWPSTLTKQWTWRPEPPLGEYLVAESRHPHIRLAAVEVGGDGHGEVPSEVVVREGVSPS